MLGIYNNANEALAAAETRKVNLMNLMRNKKIWRPRSAIPHYTSAIEYITLTFFQTFPKWKSIKRKDRKIPAYSMSYWWS